MHATTIDVASRTFVVEMMMMYIHYLYSSLSLAVLACLTLRRSDWERTNGDRPGTDHSAAICTHEMCAPYNRSAASLAPLAGSGAYCAPTPYRAGVHWLCPRVGT